MRLILVFVALAVPVVVAYPLGAASADRAIRTLIESEYAPATVAAQRPDALGAVLAQAQDEIDRIPNLLDLLALAPAGPAVQSQTAFHVWNQTSLSRDRVTSEIELYGPDPDRALVSQFALNVPEFESVTETGTPTWLGTSCRVGGVRRGLAVRRRGAAPAARPARHLRRRRAPSPAPSWCTSCRDYRALPFVSSANPYYDVLSAPWRAAAERRAMADLQVVVYGWSLQPLFTSGRVAWPIIRRHPRPAVRDRATRSGRRSRRTAHGTTSTSRSDRAGIYALGYPAPDPVRARSAGWRRGRGGGRRALRAAAARRRRSTRRWRAADDAPLRVLFHEIRTSFYRKLFLFFVLAAVGPVLLFALAFGAYMTGKFRADVEAEAVERRHGRAARVRGARRRRTAPTRRRLPPTDDVMVWIRQVIDQDVNLFDGSGARRDQPARPVRLGPAADAHAGGASIARSRSTGCRSSSARIARRLRVSRRGRAGAGRTRSRTRVLSVPLALAPARDRARDRRAQPRRARRRRCSSCCLPPASARRSPAASPIRSRG